MARQLITPTTEWQNIATGACIITVTQKGRGKLFFNETESDTTANQEYPEIGDQFEQSAAVNTKVKTSGSGWALLVDGVIA